MRYVAVAALVLAALLPATAAADNAIEPPIPYLSPGQFQQVPVSHGGFEATYACPAYASGDARNYAVRLSNGDARGNDGRLIANGPYWVTEAAALPGAAPGTCRSQLLLPTTPTPPALFLGPVAWQVYRQCAGCQGGVEVAPLAWTLLLPNVEGADLAVPRNLYAGYLARFAFGAAVDLSGTEIAVQGIGRWVRRGGWTDLARAPYEPGGENALFVKLPAGTHKLRVNIYYGSFGFGQGLPPEEVEVLRPRGPRATGARDDGRYSAGQGPPASFEAVGKGRLLRHVVVAVPLSCPGSAAAEVGQARLRSARVAPDWTVTARALSSGPTPTYATLVGKLRHRRFHGTVTASVSSCHGSRDLYAGWRAG